uniref:Uncharacterized protein n=1 Tax=Rhizophora mucronata TaxID=61149 RepID=A0A2P2NT99_RHIMU
MKIGACHNIDIVKIMGLHCNDSFFFFFSDDVDFEML